MQALDLCSNPAPGDIALAAVLRELARHPGLTSLALADTSLGSQSAAALALVVGGCKALAVLDLSKNCSLGEVGGRSDFQWGVQGGGGVGCTGAPS
jgi:hypothetical protein